MTKVIEMKKRLNFTPHPNVIFATKVDKEKTKGGIILPESKEPKTPIVEIRAIGANAKDQFDKAKGIDLEVGDIVYVDPSYMRPAEIDETIGVILMADGIFGKIPYMEEA